MTAEPVKVVNTAMSPGTAVLILIVVLLVFWLLVLSAIVMNLKAQLDDVDDDRDLAARDADDAREEAHARRPTPHPRTDTSEMDRLDVEEARDHTIRPGRHAAQP